MAITSRMKIFSDHQKYILFFLLILINFQSFSQEKRVINGRVVGSKTQISLTGVSVYTADYLNWTSTDADGKFSLEVPAQKDEILLLRMLGYENTQVVIPGNSSMVKIEMKVKNLELSEAIVTATRKKDLGSQTQITSQAIEHMQVTNIGEVMQAMPGTLLQNPNLNDPSQIVLRQAVTVEGNNGLKSTEEKMMNSLGVKTMIDGMPMSNDANLQTVSQTINSVLNNGDNVTSVIGEGSDMRDVPVENIESVEVITGVPSAKYGNLTTGVVLVETKAGYSPWNVRMKVDPKIKQYSLSKGFRFEKRKSALNVNMGYSNSLKSVYQDDFTYKRINSSFVYSKAFTGKYRLDTKTNLTFNYSFEDNEVEPNDLPEEEERFSSNKYLSFSSRGRLYLNKKFSKKLTYKVGFSSQWQKNRIKAYRSEAIQAVPTARKDTMMAVGIVPYTYLYEMNIDGNPVRFYADIQNEMTFKTGGVKHLLSFGGEWTTSKNFGKGKQFDENFPPPGGSSQSLRPRAFKDIPSLNSLSFFVEDHIKAKIFDRKFVAKLGARYENFDPTNNSHIKTKSFVNPRVNVSYQLYGNLKLKAAWGLTARSVPMVYLYPEKAYYDFLNLNYYNSLPGGQSEYFFLNTTKVVETSNPDLKVATANKKELGLVYRYKKINLQATAFFEKVKDAYTVSQIPITFERDHYELTNYNGMNSSYQYVNTDQLTEFYTIPGNNKTLTNNGFEFSARVPKIKSIQTSFSLTGSFIKSRSKYTVPIVSNKEWEPYTTVAYASGQSKVNQVFSTNITAKHHIPALRYVLTLSMNTRWNEKDYTRYPEGGEYPLYIEKFGKRNYNLTGEEKEKYKRNITNGAIAESRPPVFLFNLRMTKEIGDRCKLTASVNNLFFHNPKHRSDRNSLSFFTRNPKPYYGLTLSYKL